MKLLHGDCLEVMKTLPENSVDSMVTDPPAGISFMGKAWDDDKGGRKQWIAWMSEVMAESMRVMKPGAHGLVWAIPRTSHWTATALEDAGFEIRDVVTHLFGSGFPKSQNIGKAIDKAAGAERGVIGSHFKSGDIKSGRLHAGSNEVGVVVEIKHTAPATPEAKQWDGWGTALKPASEHWVLIRKPLAEKTIAKNVLKHGTGGINIDACRVSTGGKVVWKMPKDRKPTTESVLIYKDKPGAGSDSMIKNKGGYEGTTQGRFPANLILSDDAPAILDEQSGGLKGDSPNRKPRSNKADGGSNEIFKSTKDWTTTGHSDAGGASRFFACFGTASEVQSNKQIGESTCPKNPPSQIADSAINNLKRDVQQQFAALELVLKSISQEGKQLKNSTQLFMNEIKTQLKSNEGLSMPMIQITAEKFWLELRHTDILSKSHVNDVTTQKLIGTTRIILNLLTYSGYAEAVISRNTLSNVGLGERALRFKYCPKASKKDKGENNNHPTPKNTKLMEYLIKLVTPDGGIVLDPFMGSGSTGVACNNLGRDFIGIEQSEEYFKIAQERILLADLF